MDPIERNPVLERNLARLLTRCHEPLAAGGALRARCQALVRAAAPGLRASGPAAGPVSGPLSRPVSRGARTARLLAAAALVVGLALAVALGAWGLPRHAFFALDGAELAPGTALRGGGSVPVRIVSRAGDALDLREQALVRLGPGSEPEVEILGGRVLCEAAPRSAAGAAPLRVRLAHSTLAPARAGCIFEVFSIQEETMNANARKWLIGAGALGIGATAVAVYSGSLDWESGPAGLRVGSGESAVMPQDGAPALAASMAVADRSGAPSRELDTTATSAPGGRTVVGDRLVSGRVEVAGLPLAGASVNLVRLEPGDDGRTPIFEGSAGVFGLPGRRGALATQVTGADGSFRFAGFEDGRYLLRAFREPYAEHQGEVFAIESQRARRDERISLSPGFTVAGAVFAMPGKGPVRDAAVVASPRSAGSPLREPRTAKTDADGRFRIPGLPDGRYFVCVVAEGFETSFQDGVPHDSPQVRFELSPLTGISGVVVHAADHRPVSRFTVVAHKVERGQIPATPVRRDFEPPDGRFHFPSLPAGVFKVYVAANGLATEVRETTTVEGTTGAPLLFTLSQGGAVEGRVLVADTKAPVAGATVWSEEDLPPLEGIEVFEKSGFLAGDYGFRAVTDAEGRFTLRNVRPGTATVVAAHAEFAMGRQEDVEVRAGMAATAELPLTQGGSVAGRVVDPARTDGKPGIYLEPQGAEATPGLYGKYYVDVASDGTYRIDRVTAGAYAVVKIDNTAAVGFDTVEVKLTVVENGKTSTIDFAPGTAGVRLELEVVDQAGRPQSDHTLIAVPFSGGGGMATKTTDVNGRAVFTDIRARTLGLYQQKGFGASMLLKCVLEIPPGSKTVSQRLVLDETGFVGVAVRDHDGRPLTNATIHLFQLLALGGDKLRGSWGGMVPSDREGRFSLRSLAPGDYYVCVTAPGFGQELSEIVKLDANKVHDVGEVRLTRGGSVTVSVVDRDDKPVNGAFVLVMDEKQRTIGINPMPVTVQGGTMHGAGVKPGQYMAGAIIQGQFVGPVPFEVKEGARAEVTVKER